MNDQEKPEVNQEQPDKLADTKEIQLLTSSSEDSGSLAGRVDDQGKKIDTHDRELKRMLDLLLLGFAILLVMVGTLVWTAFTDWRHSEENAMNQLHDGRYNLLQQQYQFQQKEIEYLRETATSSAKTK